MSRHVVILGGGLAGLSCGYELVTRGHRVTVLEREPHVGGMASSFVEDGDEYWCYDFGPHRFHSRDENLIDHVNEILGDNIVHAKRLSRIVLFNKFFDYPLVAKNVVTSMPRGLLIRAFWDYFLVRLKDRLGMSRLSDEDFEGWVTRRFGHTLYRVFFGQYTEKAWGMPPSQISADWASQRISLLSLWDTVKKTLFKPSKKNIPRTLVTDFIYPKLRRDRRARPRLRPRDRRNTAVASSPTRRRSRSIATACVVTGDPVRQARTQSICEGDEYVSDDPHRVAGQGTRLRSRRPTCVRECAKALDYISIVFVYLKLNSARASVRTPGSTCRRSTSPCTGSRSSRTSARTAHPRTRRWCAPRSPAAAATRSGGASTDELEKIAERDLVSVGLIEPGQVIALLHQEDPVRLPGLRPRATRST